MSEKNTIARKNYWSTISKTERSERMRQIALKKYANMSELKRMQLGRKLNKSSLKTKKSL